MASSLIPHPSEHIMGQLAMAVGTRSLPGRGPPVDISSYVPVAELRSWLEWAGARLIAMPGGRIGPKEPTAAVWPEYSQDQWQVLDFRAALPLRAAAPSAAEIPVVDEILALPGLLPDIWRRRVLHCRALVHPINGRHLYGWDRIGELLHTDARATQILHQKALRELSRLVPHAQAMALRRKLGQ